MNSIKIFKKASRIFFFAVSFLAIANFAVPVNAESIEELQRRQIDIDAQIQKNINTIEGLIDSLQSQIATAENDVNLSVQKINLTTSQINQTQIDIDTKLKELQAEKIKLYETVKVYYENSQSDTLVVVVGSNSLSEAIDRTQYLEAISTQLNEQVAKINQAKADLETRKKQLENEKTSLEDQKNALVSKRNSLNAQKSQKDKLLNQSVAEKSNYMDKLEDLKKEHSNISDAIYAQRRASGGISYGSSDYPFYSIDIPDPWGFLTRECTSYAAWYLNEKEGKNWYNTQPGRGSAKYWDEIANTLGWTVSSSPKVGAAISWKGPLYSGDQWGHVAIVEAVNSNGTIDISEYNWVKYSYSYRSNVNPGIYGSYVYIY